MPETDDVEQAARVLPLHSVQVVTQPGAVKLTHRSGRVLHVFTGPQMLDDLAHLRDSLDDLLAGKRIAREVTLAKPWWVFWR